MLGGFGSSLILNTVVVYPVTKQLLQTPRLPRSRRKLAAIAFLTLVGLLSVGMELYQILLDRNLFKVLQVPRNADDKTIRLAYQKLAKELHPDKNLDNPHAQEQFVEMKQAYDVLLNAENREAYDRWGYDGLKWRERGEDILSQGVFQMSISYVVWFALTILLTVNSSETHARTISLAGLALILALDLQMRTGEFPIVIPFFSHLAVYQISKLLFTIYPTFIGGTITFQNVTYVDPIARNFFLLQAVVQRQNAIIQHVTEMEKELRLASKTGGLSRIQGSASEVAPAQMPSQSSLPRNVQAKIQKSREQTPKEKKGIPSFVFMIGFYILFNYILK